MTDSSVLLLHEQDVWQLVTAQDALVLLEKMLQQMVNASVANLPRRRAAVPGFVLHSMSAASSESGRALWKQYSTTSHGAQFHVGLYDNASGRMLSIMQANRLGQLRTGAISALAAKLIMDSQLGEIALIGCGWQAESQLECLATLAPGSSVRVYSRTPEKVKRFVDSQSSKLNLRIRQAASAEACVRGARTVVTMTNAREPVLDSAWLSDCKLILAGGSNQPRNAELPADVVLQASTIVVDDLEGCRNEAGDLLRAASSLADPNELWKRVQSLGSYYANRSKNSPSDLNTFDGEPSTTGWQLFKSVGMAAWDLALASYVFDQAKSKGIGKEISL